MVKDNRVGIRAALVAGTAAAAVLAGVTGAAAQDGNSVIGPPQLRDFQLEPKQRIVTQPRPTSTPAAPPAADPPAQATPQPPERTATRPFTPAPGPQAGRPATAVPRPAPAAPPSGPAPSAPTISAAPTVGTATPEVEAPTAAPDVATPPAGPAAPITAPPADSPTLPEGPPAWIYFLAFATLGLLGYGYWLRRRAVERQLAAPGVTTGLSRASAPAPAPARPTAPAAPRPVPQPRPWLELDISPERASVDVGETVIEFELTVRNSGGTEARNIRLQARMFASTPQQDKEIGDYFKAKEGEYRVIAIPPIAAGEELKIKGSVDMPQERLSALKIDGKLLFIPMIAATARYDWGISRSGQTSASWVIGRERPEGGDKMAPFRLDLGARVYRTIGKRPHKLSRRV